MRSFMLLDLHSQANFIPMEVRTWPRQQILEWLRHYGAVQEWPITFAGTAMLFRAPTGLTTTFILTDEGQLASGETIVNHS